jgi:DNA-binding MarR family transcriptional regulator
MKSRSSAGGDAFLLEDFLPYALSIAANRTSRLFSKHYSARFGLSIPQWRVLAVVGRFGSLSPSEVGERTAMDRVKVSRAAAQLVAAGLLAQEVDPGDRRGRVLRLSAAGRRMHRAIVPLARMLEARLAAGLTEAEWASLRACLQKLNDHVHRIDVADGDPDANLPEA